METNVVDGMELLEWLQTGMGDERDLQLMALEQLCMTLLMSDNIDRCFETCPPRTFLPALGRIFVDESAPENILEVTARAITYYLDVSNECTRRITQVEGAIKAICHRLVVAQMNDRTSKDLAEQCVKLLEHICQREANAVYDAGGLQAMLHLISHHDHLHKDTMHSAMAVITKLCAKMEPNDPNLPECSKNLGAMLSHDDEKIAESALRCFTAMTDRFIRRQMDPAELARPSNLVAHLFDFLIPPRRSADSSINNSELLDESMVSNAEMELMRNSAFTSAVLSLFANLCKGSSTVTTEILTSPKLLLALKVVLNCKDERCINDCLRFIDLLLVLFCEGRASISKHNTFSSDPCSSQVFDKTHRNLIDSIRQRDTDALIDAVENGTVDPNFVDDVGQTLLNWCSAFGTTDMVIYLCDKGADPNKGQRSSSLHYAACFGRTEIVKILLRYGASPNLQDEEGRTALDKARERNNEAHQQVCDVLQNPGAYMSSISSAMAQLQQQRAGQTQESKTEKEKIDHALAEAFIQQLLPVFCTIFNNSLSAGIRRVTLSLIRKCIFHISNEALLHIVYTKGGGGISPYEQSAAGIGGFVELLIGVLTIVLESGKEDVDAKEQALMIIKSLLLKNATFWAEQLIRLGVYEKIETLAKASAADEAPSSGSQTNSFGNFARPNILSTFGGSDEKKDSSSVSDKLGIAPYDRSATSTPSISLRSDSTAPSNDFSSMMANADVTPSPTVEIVGRHSSSAPIEDDDNETLGLDTGEDDPQSELDSSSAFDNDLVEAATTIAQALGVQIVEDVAEKSGEQNNAAATGMEDVWTLEAGAFYRWKDWRLIRAKDSLFVWCDAVALELSDGSNGWLRFLMNSRLSTLYSSGSPEYGADNADSRAEFIEKIQKAKSAVPSGAQTKSILSIPRPSAKPIESGNWQLSSAESGTLIISNREGVQQKLVIKDDLPGFIFESSRNHKQLFTAESTLGHDFVTGWAARGGGPRLRHFRVEVQKQKVNELAKEIWELYLKEACDRPREVVLEIQKCSERLGTLASEIVNSEKDRPGDLKKMTEELTTILTKIRNSLSDDRLLSFFEISVSGLVPALLEFVQMITSSNNNNNSDVLKEHFSGIFADPNHLGNLVRKIILVLEFVEKFPQYLYDTPGGSPFGFQLLTRRLRFRLEQQQKTKDEALVDLTNRSLKAEPLVTVAALKSHLFEHISKPKNQTPQQHAAGPSSTLSNLHYTRPPTAASIRMARKLPKMTEKLATGSSSSSSAHPHPPPPTFSDPKRHSVGPSDSLLSARSAYLAAGCLEKVGGNIKVKQTAGGGKFSASSAAGSKSAKKGGGGNIRVSKTLSTSKSQRSNNNGSKHLSNSMEKSSNDSGAGSSNGSGISQQQQKSMSTTNLFDADSKKARLAAAFNQAASAESLQHQTPSLENLISKARMHDYSIPEESMATPNSGSPEPKNLPTFDNLPSRFEKRKGSEHAQSLSIGASTFAGGSQPVLNSCSFSRDRIQTVDSSTEKLEEQHIESSAETINEGHRKQEQEVAELLNFMDGQFMMDDDFGDQEAPTSHDHAADNEMMEVTAEGDGEMGEEAATTTATSAHSPFNIVFGNADGSVDLEATTSSASTSAAQSSNKPDAPHPQFYKPKRTFGQKQQQQQQQGTSSANSGRGGRPTNMVGSSSGGGFSSTAAGTSESQQQQISNIGSDIRVKLGSYAEMLKHMMNQVFDGGDSAEIYDGDEFDNEIYEDELLNQYFIEAECEPQISEAGYSLSSDSSSIVGGFQQQAAADQPPANAATTSATIGTKSNIISEASTVFDTISQAAGSTRAAAVAAIRAAMERNENIFSAIHSHPIEVMLAPTAGERQQRWRQMLEDEIGSYADSGCARAIRIGANRAQLAGIGAGWNDDFVLRQQFGALIPAFDPRPGRTNVNQTQELELTDEVEFNTYQQRKGSILTERPKSQAQQDENCGRAENIRLFLKKKSVKSSVKPPPTAASTVAEGNGGIEEEEELIELKDGAVSVFNYVQELLLSQNANNGNGKAGGDAVSIHQFANMSSQQIWDITFTLVYEILKTDDASPNEEEGNEEADSIANKKEEDKDTLGNVPPLVGQALELIRLLHSMCQTQNVRTNNLPSVPVDIFFSSKLTQKLQQELTDPLVVSARTMPRWCGNLVYNFPCLFSVDTRLMYLNTTAFGTSRAIGYLQGKRDQLLEQNRSATSTAGTNMAGTRREDHYPEYRIGRVKHERIKVHRNEKLFLESAIKVLKFHAMRKSILEIEYYGEEGTGLGPTLEFFALIAAEFQRKDLCMWHCDDSTKDVGTLSEGLDQSKPPGYYVHSKFGLFPAPWPSNADKENLLELFQLFGVFIAKTIQDDRLVDLPLSPLFLKLALSAQLASAVPPSIESILDIDDFMQIFPEKAKMLMALTEFVARRDAIESDWALDFEEKVEQIDELRVNIEGTECHFEDLALTFAVNPPSSLFPYEHAELIEDGLKTEVNAQNAHLYVQKCMDFYLNTGIRDQMLAFRNGFDMVFPLASLIPFSATELQTVLSGEQCPKWSREDLLRFTEPKLGYTRDSAGFLNFVEVLANFDASERKAFLQFTTGCSSLPPGGLANLHPRLTIVRKVGSGDGSYPSVNTCVHYLKLPEYSSAEILRERLLAATFEKGFHLN